MTMGLFSKKNSDPRPPAPPSPQPAPPSPPPKPPSPRPVEEVLAPRETAFLKVDLPDIFAYNNDETKLPALVAQRQRGRVLLVESDDEIRRLLSRLLVHEGYAVQTATCLAEAREISKEFSATSLLARRACVPLNSQTEQAVRDLQAKTDVRIVDEFTDLILGQVVDYESVAQSMLRLTSLLVSLIEAAHTGMRGHAHNVAKYCRLVGQRLGLKRRDLDGLTLAATLHELGALETEHQTSAVLTENNRPASSNFPSALELLADIAFPYAINELLAGAAVTATTGSIAAGLTQSRAAPGTDILRVVETYETLRRSAKAEFQEEAQVFDWMRRQPTGLFDSEALETLIDIRKNERAISAMNIFLAAVLIVDPRPQDVQLLRLRLENDDYHVITARTLEEAIQKLHNEPITLILTEYQLDQPAGGVELLRIVKADPALRQIPVIFHAPANTDLVKRALEIGAEDWYPKPFNVEITAMKLQRVISRIHASPTGMRAGVQGNLREMGIIEMVQILSSGGRSVQIQLENNGRTAELVLQAGKIISANVDQRTGEDAALEILTWREGIFRIAPLKSTAAVTVTATTDTLLLQSCARRDPPSAPAAPLPSP